jgi:hypothetical protein
MATEALVEVHIPLPSLPTSPADAVALAELLEVNSQATLDLASLEFNCAREQHDALDAMRMSLKRPILEAGRRVDDFFRAPLETLQRIIDVYNGKMASYLHEQERLVQQEAFRVREEERTERARIAREAEERERQGREEAQRLREASAEAARTGNQSAAGQLLSEASRAELAGVQDAQEQLSLIETVRVAPGVEAPELHGITKPRARYSAECLDLEALHKAVYEGRQPKLYITHNQEALDRAANALRDEFKVDGCKLVVDYTVPRSRKRSR